MADKQEISGWTIVAIVLLIFWWLSQYGVNFLHGQTAVVSSSIGGVPTGPGTVTTYPCSACGG